MKCPYYKTNGGVKCTHKDRNKKDKLSTCPFKLKNQYKCILYRVWIAQRAESPTRTLKSSERATLFQRIKGILRLNKSKGGKNGRKDT